MTRRPSSSPSNSPSSGPPKRALAAAVAALCCASIACHATDADGWHAAPREFLGEDRVQRLTSAETAAAWRVDGGFDAPRDGRALMSGFPVLGEGPALTPAQRARLLGLVQDADSYLFDVAKACIFSPGVAVRFDGPAGPLDVLLCFSCDEWAFALPTADGERESWVVEDCDPARAELRAMARAWFPDDPAFR